MKHLWTLEGQRQVLDIFGGLFVRSAHMLDYAKSETAGWRYQPPPRTVAFLSERQPAVKMTIRDTPVQLPILSFLCILELIALNEDVKYRNNKNFKNGVGRKNTMMTMANMAAAGTGSQYLHEFVGELIVGRGVSPITMEKARKVFASVRGSKGLLGYTT